MHAHGIVAVDGDAGVGARPPPRKSAHPSVQLIASDLRARLPMTFVRCSSPLTQVDGEQAEEPAYKQCELPAEMKREKNGTSPDGERESGV